MARIPEVSLDRFSGLRAPRQADDIQPLVHANKHWLPDSPYAGAATRYGEGYWRAVRHIARVSRHHDGPAWLHPFVIRTEQQIGVVPPRTAIGIGTIITHQALEVPNAKPNGGRAVLHGSDLDYWLDAELAQDPDLHRTVAATMLVRSFKLAVGRRGDDSLVNFATVQPGHSHQPEGFPQVLREVGGPCAPQLADRPDDPFGILKEGRLLQVYAMGEISPIADAARYLA